MTCLCPQVVNNVVALYNKSLAASTVKGSLVGLRSLEETANRNDGSRFLLEMDVQLHQPQEQTVHTSEYVYLKKGSSQLCHTSNFQWTKNAHVHFIVSGVYFSFLCYFEVELFFFFLFFFFFFSPSEKPWAVGSPSHIQHGRR